MRIGLLLILGLLLIQTLQGQSPAPMPAMPYRTYIPMVTVGEPLPGGW